MENVTTDNKLVTIHTEVIEGNNLLKNSNRKTNYSLVKIEENTHQRSELVNYDDKSAIKQSFHSILSQGQQNEHTNMKFQKKTTNDNTIFQQLNQEEEIRHQKSITFSKPSSPDKIQRRSDAPILKSNSKENQIMLQDISGINIPNLIEEELRHQSSNQKQKIQTSMSLSIIVKLIKATKIFKSYMIPNKINQKQARIIHDLSFYDSSFSNRKKKKPNTLKHAYKKFILYSQKQNYVSIVFNKIYDELKDFIDKFFQLLDQTCPVIEASNTLKIIFDIFKIIVTSFAIFLNTVEVTFDLNFDELYPDVIQRVRYIIIGFYTFCIFLSLNTAITKQGMIEHQRKEIFKIYFSKRFISDSISIISFIRFDLQRIPRDIIKLFILAQDFSHSNKNRKLFYIIRLIKLLLTIILVAHFVAIAFYGQTLLFDFDHKPNWVNQSTLVSINDNWYTKYIFALYFSVTTMMTVGYGDISPKNSYEAIFCTISMVIACGVFAYSFNLIGLIISDMNKKERQFKKKINKVNLYLSDRNIDEELRTKVQKFYEYKQNFIFNKMILNLIINFITKDQLEYIIYHCLKQILIHINRFKHSKTLSKKDEEQILQELSPYLLEKIVFQTKQKILNSDKAIFGRFSEEFRNQLCLKLKEVHVNKDEVIFEQGSTQDDPLIYFIHKGCIEIYYKNKYNEEGIPLKCLSNGQIFGENSFLLNTARSANAKAIESSILYTLSKSDFINQLSYFTFEKQKYHFIINNLIFRQSNTIISQQCYSCHSEKHLITSCPRLHFKPEKDLVILKANYPIPHSEREYCRRKRGKESGYSVLNIKKQYELEEPMGIQKENLEFPENKQQTLDKNDLVSETSTDEKSSQSKSERKEPIKTLNTWKSITKEHNSPKASPKFTDTIVYFPQEDETMKVQSLQNQIKSMQFQESLRDQQSMQPISIKSTVDQTQMSTPSTQTFRMVQRQQQYFTHQNQYKGPSSQQTQEQKQNAIEKAKQQFKIPKMSFNDEVLNTSDISLGEIDELNRSPINQIPKSLPASRKQSLFKRILPHTNKRSGSKEFHYSDTIRDLVQFKDKFQASHQKIGKGGLLVSTKLQRKSILKSNTTKPNKDQLEAIKKIVEQQKPDVEIEEIIDISDKMKSFKYFYPNFNYQKVIQHYNMLTSIQNCKLPSYFNTYSIQNRKNQNLRNQALKAQQSRIKF